TTILSSTGARCHHIDHVATQLPYALAVALVSCIGFVVLGMTASVMFSLAAATMAFIIVCAILSWLSKAKIESCQQA
ncbi:Na+/H+ antiporter NhaC family protein, partial [Vibrio diabolicus]|nr:Na+/H+ antiporter NhaC family protein [Vibrio diabolicus]